MEEFELDGGERSVMTEEELAQKWPKFYMYHPSVEGRHSSQISMALFGMEHGDGWNKLVDEALQKLDQEGTYFVITSQKEKYGTLRLSHGVIRNKDSNMTAKYVGEVIRGLREVSKEICEKCGDGGEMRTEDGWARVRCDSCFDPG